MICVWYHINISCAFNRANKLVCPFVFGLIDVKLSLSDLITFKFCQFVVKLRKQNVFFEYFVDVLVNHGCTICIFTHLIQKITVLHFLCKRVIKSQAFKIGQSFFINISLYLSIGAYLIFQVILLISGFLISPLIKSRPCLRHP